MTRVDAQEMIAALAKRMQEFPELKASLAVVAFCADESDKSAALATRIIEIGANLSTDILQALLTTCAERVVVVADVPAESESRERDRNHPCGGG